MKRFKAIWLLLLLLIPTLLLSGCESVTTRANTQDTWSRIERRKKVIVGLDDSFVPMGFRQKNGKLVGYDVDLARAVFKQYGIKVDFQPIDWSMKETELKNGRSTCCGTVTRSTRVGSRRWPSAGITWPTAKSW